jgi:hypothetical protein
MKVSLIVLLLAALLVAMPVAAGIIVVSNGADALMLGTKISVQEEVGGALDAENVAAPAVAPNELQTSAIIMASATVKDAVHYFAGIFPQVLDSYKPTPGAGGDGLLARFS